MDCNNCGAPMRLINNRNYFICDYCGTYGIPDANRDGVRLLGEMTPFRCPICQTFLATASAEENRVLQCPNCRGVLFDQLIFANAVSYQRDGSAPYEPPPRLLDRNELERSLRCPKCNKTMDTHFYGGAENIVIDNCYSCRLIWLDCGELDRIVTASRHEREKTG